MFWSFHPLADKTNNEHLPKPFFKVIGLKSLCGNTRSQRYFVFCCPLSFFSKSFSVIRSFLESTAHFFVVVLCFYILKKAAMKEKLILSKLIIPYLFLSQKPILQNFLFEVFRNYNATPFHNFRHAFCVTQMVRKRPHNSLVCHYLNLHCDHFSWHFFRDL